MMTDNHEEDTYEKDTCEEDAYYQGEALPAKKQMPEKNDKDEALLNKIKETQIRKKQSLRSENANKKISKPLFIGLSGVVLCFAGGSFFYLAPTNHSSITGGQSLDLIAPKENVALLKLIPMPIKKKAEIDKAPSSSKGEALTKKEENGSINAVFEEKRDQQKVKMEKVIPPVVDQKVINKGSPLKEIEIPQDPTLFKGENLAVKELSAPKSEIKSLEKKEARLTSHEIEKIHSELKETHNELQQKNKKIAQYKKDIKWLKYELRKATAKAQKKYQREKERVVPDNLSIRDLFPGWLLMGLSENTLILSSPREEIKKLHINDYFLGVKIIDIDVNKAKVKTSRGTVLL